MYGQGGIGKTVLAAAPARDAEVRRYFPDGVFWVTVGEQGDLVAAQLACWPGSGGRGSGAAVGRPRERGCCGRCWPAGGAAGGR